MRTIIIIALLLAGIYVLYKVYSTSQIEGRLDKLLSGKVLILDVRTPGEFAGGHIEGAVNIPLSALHTCPLAFDPKVPVITCCSHGLRSIRAVKVLKERGFANVYNGGAWTELAKRLPHK